MDTERDLQIRELAYRLWEDAGRPDGGADEFWYAAERLLADEDQALREEPAPFEGVAEEAAAVPEEAVTTASPKRRAATR